MSCFYHRYSNFILRLLFLFVIILFAKHSFAKPNINQLVNAGNGINAQIFNRDYIGVCYFNSVNISTEAIPATIDSTTTIDPKIQAISTNSTDHKNDGIPPISPFSFTPGSGGTGTVVTITGTGFNNATVVKFGAALAASFTILSDSVITAVVGNGNSGAIGVFGGNRGDSTAMKRFMYLSATDLSPQMAYYTPHKGATGDIVTIHGINFSNITSVYVSSGKASSFTVIGDTLINAVVGIGSSYITDVIVTTTYGKTSINGFSYIYTPRITSFSPTQAKEGDLVSIYGSYFTGVTSASFGGVPASEIYVESDTYMEARVGQGGSGNVTLTTPNGSGSLAGFTFPRAPHIYSFTPTSAKMGDVVTIKGIGLLNTYYTYFGESEATSTSVLSDTVITAILGSGSSGYVWVFTPNGMDTLSGFNYLSKLPIYVNSFFPSSGTKGDTIRIRGSNFTGITGVSFGYYPAMSFSAVSDSLVLAIVNEGNSGDIIITNAYGSNIFGMFTYNTPPPSITSFSPSSGLAGTTITIKGSYLTDVTAVLFDSSPAVSFNESNGSAISAKTDAGTSGFITVVTATGSATFKNYPYIITPPLHIDSFTPASAVIGSTISIKGTSFTGVTAVSFGAKPATSFSVISDSLITAVVGLGDSGIVKVQGPLGKDSLASFKLVNSPPTIYSFSPANGFSYTFVTIKGTHFTGATAVSVGNTAVYLFNVVNDSTITANVASSTGYLTVTTPYGTNTFNEAIYTNRPYMRVTSFSPTSGGTGTVVTFKGTSFSCVTSVKFNWYDDATSFTIISDSVLTAVVGQTSTGPIYLQGTCGTDTVDVFTYLPNAPVVFSFTPTTAVKGTPVNVKGIHFSGATAVLFGNIEASSFTVVNDSTITAIPSPGSGGNITVTTSVGSNTLFGLNYIEKPATHIISFTPEAANEATFVTINGVSFTGTTSVRFGGKPASSFTIVYDSVITAIVGSGATGYVTIINPNGNDSLAGFTYIIPSPKVTSFTPVSAATGTIITIRGNHLTNTQSVSFGNVPASSFTIINDSTLTAIVGNGATGVIKVTSASSFDTSKTEFTCIVAPIVKSFTPVSGTTGTSVIITGSHFTGTSSVSFGGTAASSYTVSNDSTITAIVGDGSTGTIIINNPASSDTSQTGFTYLVGPTVQSFTPVSGTTGTRVIISGSHFTGTSSVTFGGAVASSFTVSNDSTILAIVANGSTGVIKITNNTYSDTSKTRFTYVAVVSPVIKSFTPVSGATGTSVIISGSHFTGTSSVKFGGIAASSFTVSNNDSTITAIIGSGATGFIEVVNNYLGDTSLNSFTYIIPPIVKSFIPTSATTGTMITIRGTHLTNTQSVNFGNVPASSFTIINDSTLTAIVGDGATGYVTIRNPNGNDSLIGFTYINPSPKVLSFTPTSAATGTSITIHGSHFGEVTSVSFGGTAAMAFSVINDTTITSIVGKGTSGFVKVTTPYGSDTLLGFSYIATVPSISDFYPDVAESGTTIMVHGTHFTGTVSVSFGGTEASSFQVLSDTLLTAIMGNGASGYIKIITSTGSDSLPGVTYFVQRAPHLTSFTPAQADDQGTYVTIHGVQLRGVNSVSFGGEPASFFTVIDDSTISAFVRSGASGYVKVTNTISSDSMPGFKFFVLQPPHVLSFSPVMATEGGIVIIHGNHFNGANYVSFGRLMSASFSVLNDSTITAVVSSGASGYVQVNNYLSGDSLNGFIYGIPLKPYISSFTPTSAATGTRVTISGSHFAGTSLVTFGGAAASSFTVSDDSTIIAIVANGSTGVIKVANVTNADTSKTRFTYVAVVAPVIKSFTPVSGTTGTSVVISGSHFTGTSSVKFGGIAASSFTVSNDSTITAIVGTGATGFIEVVNNSLGDTSLTGFTYIPKATPVINATSSLSSFKTCSGISSTQNFAVSGSKLIANVIITASNNLEISTNLNNSYGANLNVSVTDTLYKTTVYVRVKASSIAGIYNDTVLIASSGANPKYIYVRDTINALPITPVIVGNGPLNFCSGAGVLLTDSVSTGNQWFINDSAINGANSTTYSATVSGNYTVKTTNASGCISAASKVTAVKVNPNPAVNFTIPSACSGKAIYFIDSTTLSDGTQNLSVYNWNFGDGSTSDLKKPIHTYLSSDSYTAKLVVTSVNGCKDSVTRQVMINPQPRASFTVSNIACSNIPVSFSDSGSANGSVIKNWKWSFGDSVSNTNTTSQNTVHAYSYPGTYPVILSVTSDKGCTDSMIKSIVINVIPTMPVVSPGITLCQGTTAEALKAELLNGDSLWWYNQATGGNGSTAAPVPITSSIGKTNYYVSQKNNTTSCESQRANITVIVNPYPVTPTVTSSGNQLISSASTYYKWYYYDSLIANYTSDTIGLLAKGLYKVSTSIDNICWSDSKDYLAQSNPVGTIQKDYQLTIYPNPASSQFYIDIKLDAEYSGNMKFSLVNLSGTASYVYQKYIFNSRRIKIPVKYNLGNQVYVLTVTINGYLVKTIKITGM